MSAITFEQQQIFKDAITEIRGNISSVLYCVSHNDLNYQHRNYETIIDLASTFSRVFDSVPSFSARFHALFDVFNQSRLICFHENKIEWFLSKIQLVLESWLHSLNPLPCSTAVFAQGREDGAADPVSNKAVQPKIPASLQSLGAVDTGFVPECSHCSNDYWIASPAPDAAFCPFCGFSGLADSECAFDSNSEAFVECNNQSLAPEGLAGYAVAGYIFKTITVNRLHRLGVFTFDQLYEYTQRDLVSDGLELLVFNRQSSRRFIADINESLELRGFPTLRVS